MFQWLKKLWNAVNGTSRRSLIRRALAGDSPGGWVSDHLEETERIKGYAYCAIRALARQFAQAEVECSDPVAMRLLTRPNPKQSGAILRYAAAQQLSATGTAHHWIVRNSMGVPVEMYILPTGLTRAQPPSDEFPCGAWRVNPLNNYGSISSLDGWIDGSPGGTLLVSGAEIDARDVHSVRWPHPLFLNEGLSPMSAGALEIDIAEEIKRARWYAVRNRSNPGLIIKLGEGIHPDEQEQLEEEIAARNARPENARRNLLLPPNTDVVQRDAVTELDFSGPSHDQSRQDVLSLFSTPPVAVGVSEAGNYSAFYAAMLQYIELEVQPELDLLGDELGHALNCRVVYKARRMDDPTIEQQRVAQDIAAGAITINEYRATRNYPPVPWGDVPIGKPVAAPKSADATTTAIPNPV